MSDPNLRHSPLDDVHRRLGAKLAPFGGWLMPIEYAGTLAEHRAVRERVGLFDLSHLGRVAVGRAQYHHLLNERGGVEEDLFVYRLGEERWFAVPNASNKDAV